MALILSCATGQDQWAITDLTRRFPMKSALKRVVLVLLLLSVTVVAAYTGPTDSALRRETRPICGERLWDRVRCGGRKAFLALASGM